MNPDSQQQRRPRNHNKELLGLTIAGTTIVGTLALTAPFVLQYLRSPLPYMATPKDKVQRALQFIAMTRRCTRSSTRDQTTQNRHYFLDLGSGDGEAVYQALQVKDPHADGYYFTHATGIELNSTLWGLSQVRRIFLWQRQERRRSSFLCRDMFAHDWSRADTLMIFGVAPLMKPMSEKLARDCRDGAFVLAYRFPIPLAIQGNRNSSDIPREEAQLLTADLIYEEEEMRIYQCRKESSTSIDSSNRGAKETTTNLR